MGLGRVPLGLPATVPSTSLTNKGPRGRVFAPETYGAKADLVAFYDGAMTAGSTTITSASFTTASLPAGAGSKNIYIAWAGAGTAAGTTSAGVSTGSPITTIPRTSGAAVPAGPLLITSGANAQLFNTAGASLNASITVTSSTPIFSFPSGSTLTFGNPGLSTTVQSVANGSAVLGAAATSSVQNMVGWYGTDDTTAVLAMRTAIGTSGGTELWGGAGYLLDGAPIATGNGWAIIPFPLITQGSLTMLGSAGVGAGASALTFTNAEISGTVLATTRQSDVYSASHGPPSMMGGPTYEATSNTSQSPQIGMVRMEDITFLRPENPSIGGVDCSLVARAEHRRCYCKTAGQINRAAYNFAAGSLTAYNAMGQLPTHAWNFGFWMPDNLNYAQSISSNCGAVGDYCAFVLSAHTVLDNCFSQFCTQSLGFNDLNSRLTGVHLNRLTRYGSFDCPTIMGGWDPVNGTHSLAASANIVTITGEIAIEAGFNQWTAATSQVLDANGRIRGRIMNHNYSVSSDVKQVPTSSTLQMLDVDAAGLVPPTYDDLVLAEAGLLSYYPLNDPTGATAKDATARANGTITGTLIGGLQGPMGDASLKFSGTTQYVTLDTLSTLATTLATTTVEFWINMGGSAGNNYILGAIGGTTAATMFIRPNFANGINAAGSTTFAIGDNNNVNKRVGHITTNLYDSLWHHVVWNISTTGTHAVFVDGVPVTVTMDTSGTLGTMSAFDIAADLAGIDIGGGIGHVQQTPCRLHRVAFYTTQLTTARIQQHYQAALRTR